MNNPNIAEYYERKELIKKRPYYLSKIIIENRFELQLRIQNFIIHIHIKRMEIYENLSLSYSHAIECSISWQGLLQNKKLKLNLASVCEEHRRKKKHFPNDKSMNNK